MKKIIAAAFALTVLGAPAASAAVSIRIGGPVHHPIVHHRHRVCEYRHHHRVCFWR